MKKLLYILAAGLIARRIFQQRSEPSPPIQSPPLPVEPDKEAVHTQEINRYYNEIAKRREGVPKGCRRDRYGILYEKNPNGFGWRELGSDPDEPYWVRRLD